MTGVQTCALPIFEVTAPLLFVIGGFTLYLFWEAKSQYVMVYVLALVPYASSGLLKLSNLTGTRRGNPEEKTGGPSQVHATNHIRSVKEVDKASKKSDVARVLDVSRS